MALPIELGVIARTMENYTSNRFKLEVQGSGASAKQGNIVSVLLPENSLIDLKSLRWCFRMTGKAAGAAGISIIGDDVRSVIQSVNVFINGVSVQQNMPEYNTLCHVLGLIDNNTNRENSVDNVLSNGLMYSGTSKTTPEDKDFVVDKWRGFLGESNMRYLDTSLFGSVQIRITLAPPAAAVAPYCSDGTLGFEDVSGVTFSALDYELHDLHFTIDCISLGMDYGRVLKEMVAREGVLPVNYREYYNYPLSNQSGTSFVNRFQLSTQSLNMLLSVNRRGDYAAGEGLKPYNFPTNPVVKGAYKHDKALSSGAYTNAYYKFCSFTDEAAAKADLNTDMTYQWSVNNVSMPQFPSNLKQAVADLIYYADKCDTKRDFGNMVSTFEDFKLSKCIIPLRLSFNDNIALMSGYSTRGVNSTLSLSVRNLNQTAITQGSPNGTFDNLVFASTTATLRVAEGKALAVSY